MSRTIDNRGEELLTQTESYLRDRIEALQARIKELEDENTRLKARVETTQYLRQAEQKHAKNGWGF